MTKSNWSIPPKELKVGEYYCLAWDDGFTEGWFRAKLLAVSDYNPFDCLTTKWDNGVVFSSMPENAYIGPADDDFDEIDQHVLDRLK